MEITPYAAGWLSILPPIIAIGLALISKEVLSSLLLGILSGSLIWALGTGANPVMGTVSSTFGVMVAKLDFTIILFTSMLGALVYCISLSGATKAYGAWALSRIKTRRGALLSTTGLGICIFIDDYFSCLTTGTVMRPVTDAHHISRTKLAYLVDTTAAPVCIIAPVSSWAAAVGSSLKSTGAFSNDLAAFTAAIPWNFYAILAIALAIFISWTNYDFGPMRRFEKEAMEGRSLGAGRGVVNSDALERAGTKGRVCDMVVPILALIGFAVFSLLYVGGYWGDDPKYHTIVEALGNTSASKALVWACFGAHVVALLMFVPRGVLSFREYMNGFVEGVKVMLPANMILVLAWALSGVCRDMLQTPQFIQGLVQSGSMAAILLPAVIFLVAAFLSFSTGTAWGTFGILIPIMIPIAQSVAPDMMIVILSATLAGSVFGDHCSPISDTTILSSAGSGCNHIDHVSTQLPYSCTIAACAFTGYLVAGLTHGNWAASFGTAAVLLAAASAALHFYHRPARAGSGRA
ncbi:Na+/H+ antiporter NhaC family protein [Mesosutterella sp. AGMB02718]|uniref:Na+/H+ antiporter NhaC family protein n=1 Tax=Mesosutterella faecium TaxID=2925194 RepID=A0ABT7INW3_9BURK|nr:Na+/H+ antiporter NhaC family protein [Mesosutterella sp. AGMB02718]MDL2059566.1 Na+/H+ antiporter NhaC family protein [Mesosutterella sp. AGMB02718]